MKLSGTCNCPFDRGIHREPYDRRNKLTVYAPQGISKLSRQIHSALKMVSFEHLFEPFWHHFPPHELPNGAQSAKKEPFKKQQKNDQILEVKLAPK